MTSIFTLENRNGSVLNRYCVENTPDNIDKILDLNDAGHVDPQNLEDFVEGRTSYIILNENANTSNNAPFRLTRQTGQDIKEQLRKEHDQLLKLIDAMLDKEPI